LAGIEPTILKSLTSEAYLHYHATAKRKFKKVLSLKSDIFALKLSSSAEKGNWLSLAISGGKGRDKSFLQKTVGTFTSAVKMQLELSFSAKNVQKMGAARRFSRFHVSSLRTGFIIPLNWQRRYFSYYKRAACQRPSKF
jgi:hypothetical protein